MLPVLKENRTDTMDEYGDCRSTSEAQHNGNSLRMKLKNTCFFNPTFPLNRWPQVNYLTSLILNLLIIFKKTPLSILGLFYDNSVGTQ